MKNGQYLTINRIEGDPETLLSGYRESAGTMTEVGRDHGLIIHAAAPTDSGLLIVNVWPSRDESEAAARDPRRLGEMRANRLSPGQMNAEHHWLESFTWFDRKQPAGSL